MSRLPLQASREQTLDLEIEPAAAEEKTSAFIRRLLNELPSEQVSVGYLLIHMRRRSFGGLFILLGALALLPGISAFAGLAMMVPGFQMAFGYRAPLLPRLIRQRKIDRDAIRALGNRGVSWLELVERCVRPRWTGLTTPPMPNIIGLLVIGLGIVVVLPLPFSNFPPTVALFLLSLGLLERDGLLVLIGLVSGLVALVIGVAITILAIKAAALVL